MALSVAILRSVPDPDNLHSGWCDPIDDHIRPEGRDLARSEDQTWSTPLRKIFEPVARRDQRHRDPGRRERVPFADVLPDRREVGESLRREGYGHSGGGSSL